jgi:hypothetical protein
MQTPINPVHALFMRILNQPKFAWVVSLPLACFDITAWVALTIVCLIILRKGIQSAWNLMCAVFVCHGLSLYWYHPQSMSWINAALDMLPAYIGAIALYFTRSWYKAACYMLLMLLVVLLGIDKYFPNFADLQLNQLVTSARDLSSQLTFPLKLVEQAIQTNRAFCAHLVIGMQMLSVVFNAIISLTMARSIQSQLFYPQGFLNEMLGLRGCRWLLLSVVISLGIVFKSGWLFPLYILPTLLFYFFCVGLSVGVSALSKNRTQIVFLVLTAASIFLPYIFVPVYVVVGAMDSFVNFRHFLAKRVKYTF